MRAPGPYLRALSSPPLCLSFACAGPTCVTLYVSSRGYCAVITVRGVHAPAKIGWIRQWKEGKLVVPISCPETPGNAYQIERQPRAPYCPKAESQRKS